MEDISDVLKYRRAIRKYKEEPVPDEMIDKIIEAGLYAPTGMNRQQTIILKITDKETLEKLAKINGKIAGNENKDPFYGAPVLLSVLSEKDNPTGLYDGCSVISNMLNEAASLGLGSCWIHRGKEQFETDGGKEILKKAGIDSEKYEGVDNIIVGFEDGAHPEAKPRKENRVFCI